MDAVDVLNPGAVSPFLLLGDHAGRAIPTELGNLGLGEAVMLSHIAWDIGVAGLGAALARELDATFVSQRYSRLVIDCNRDPGAADSIAETSDGVRIPGNLRLTEEARLKRRRDVFDVYHGAIASELDARSARGSIIVSLHSFTPSLAGGAPRPWRFGVLHMGASPASQRLLETLRQQLGVDEVGDNEPYRMDGVDYTIPHHAIARGLDYVELEVRQDLLARAADQQAVAALLAASIQG